MSPFFEGILSGMFIGMFIGIFGIALMQASRKNWIGETSEESERVRLRLRKAYRH